MQTDLVIHDAFRAALNRPNQSDSTLIEHFKIIVRRSPPSADRSMLEEYIEKYESGDKTTPSAARVWMLMTL
ncbi:hypothetical protein PSAL108031_12290 [Ectopseudomonas alcaliphila]